MMNALALGLVLTSLVTAGFFSPKSEEDVIVKEGRRVVVVEYEKDVGNTKVSISPQDKSEEGPTDFAREKIEEINARFRPRELLCDAYGKCKHKLSTVMGKTAEEAVEKVKESVVDSAGKAKEKASGIKDEASRRMEGAKEKAGGIKDEASRRMEGAKGKVAEKASGIKEEVSRRTEGAKERVKEEASRRAEGAKREGGKEELGEITRRARDVVAGVFSHAFSAGGVVHLMGFAAAYGMCVWVTFGSSHVLAGALPRQQFAVVQSRIYPLYFKAMGCSIGMALLGHLMSPRKTVGTTKGSDLVAALALILVNLLYLEPRATKVMHERMKMEKEEGTRKEVHATEHASTRAPDSTAETAGRGSAGAIRRGKKDEAKTETMIQLSQTLQRLNSYSSFLNVMTLVALTWHLVRLGQRLHVVC